jgi:hypothetical protein
MALSPAASALKKAVANAALINVDSGATPLLRDCFKQFGIDTRPLSAPEQLLKEKFDACVITLNEEAESFLEAARNSPSNRRIVIFGICASVGQAIRFSKYGINVLLEQPVDRQAALRAVRATHLLVINEFRRYVRIPIVVEVDAVSGMQHVTGSTSEVSGGGMSLRCNGKFAIGDEAQLTFDLPGRVAIKVRGLVCWVRPAQSSIGIRFDPPDQSGRELVKRWIDDYLEIS